MPFGIEILWIKDMPVQTLHTLTLLQVRFEGSKQIKLGFRKAVNLMCSRTIQSKWLQWLLCERYFDYNQVKIVKRAYHAVSGIINLRASCLITIVIKTKQTYEIKDYTFTIIAYVLYIIFPPTFFQNGANPHANSQSGFIMCCQCCDNPGLASFLW